MLPAIPWRLGHATLRQVFVGLIQSGRFVGYDSESKGFRIYWPGKRSVTVELNVVFNENDIRNDSMVSIPNGALSEGEKESKKVIQYPKNSVENLEKAEGDLNDVDQPEVDPSEDDQEPKTLNTIPFPKQDDEAVENRDNETPQTHERRQSPGRFKGTYKGMTAAVTVLNDQDDDTSSAVEEDPRDEGYFNCFYDLPPMESFRMSFSLNTTLSSTVTDLLPGQYILNPLDSES